MSERILKINQLIKQELSQILLRRNDFSRQVLVTIVGVETSKDLVQSKIYVSIIPKEQSSNIIRALKKQIYDIQQEINKRLKLRIIPKIRFIEEKRITPTNRVEEILQEIKKADK